MNHEVTYRSFGCPDDRDIAPVQESPAVEAETQESPAVEAETQESEETLATNAPEGVDKAPALPVDESPAEEAPEVQAAPTEE